MTKNSRTLGTGRRGNPWTERELQILRKWYPIEGYLIQKRLPRRTLEVIRKKAFSLKIFSEKEYKYGDWTIEEDKILMQLYPSGSACVQSKLPHRSIAAIQQRALRLGIKKVESWSKVEEEILSVWYPIEGAEVIHRLSGRSTTSIYRKAYRMGLTRKG